MRETGRIIRRFAPINNSLVSQALYAKESRLKAIDNLILKTISLLAKGLSGTRPQKEIDELQCSFCGSGKSENGELISGPDVFICENCVSICNEIIEEGAQGERCIKI